MELDSMASESCTMSGSAHFPGAAAVFQGADGPMASAPTCSPSDGASFQAHSHETHPTRGV